MGSHRGLEGGEPVRGGAPDGDAVVVVDEPAERILHASEGRIDLHQLTELDGAAEEARRLHDEGEDHRGLPKGGREGNQVLLLADQLQVVLQHRGEAQLELAVFDLFAAVERNGLAVFANPHQMVPEVGFVALLLEVQADQRAPDEVRDHGTGCAVGQRNPDHRARHCIAAAEERDADHAAERPEDADEAHQGHHRIEQAHRQRHRVVGEELHVFLDALVGVVGRLAVLLPVAREFEAVEGPVGHPAREIAARHPGAPAQLQELRQIELEDGDHDIAGRDPAEKDDLPPEHRLVLVLQRVVEACEPLVVQHQHVDRAEIERHDRRKKPARPPFSSEWK